MPLPVNSVFSEPLLRARHRDWVRQGPALPGPPLRVWTPLEPVRRAGTWDTESALFEVIILGTHHEGLGFLQKLLLESLRGSGPGIQQ